MSIASYRDSETYWTLSSLFGAAHRPERVVAAVVWQVDLETDSEFMRLGAKTPWRRQVRHLILDHSEARGPCHARALAQKLWQGEEYCLQIDSHTRFVDGWDTELQSMLADAERMSEHGKAVISTYPPGYEREGASASLPPDRTPTALAATHFDADGMLRIKGVRLPSRQLPAPLPARFWAAGLSFSRGSWVAEVPYPGDLQGLFFGEEMLMLARMWCRGWDVFSPPTSVAFHLWSRAHRPTFQQDAVIPPAQRAAAQERVKALLAGRAGDSCWGKGVGAGVVRSLEQWYQHTGVDFSRGTLSQKAMEVPGRQ